MTTTTETPIKQSSTPTTEIARQIAMPNAADALQRMNEAAHEAFGILETLHEGGHIPPHYRDLCEVVNAKYRQARREINRGKA